MHNVYQTNPHGPMLNQNATSAVSMEFCRIFGGVHLAQVN